MDSLTSNDRSIPAPRPAVTLYVVYDRPVTHPTRVVVQPIDILPRDVVPHGVGALFSNLSDAREWCAGIGKTCIGRMDHGDPKVVEVWR